MQWKQIQLEHLTISMLKQVSLSISLYVNLSFFISSVRSLEHTESRLALRRSNSCGCLAGIADLPNEFLCLLFAFRFLQDLAFVHYDLF